jgi:hypothetical protein
MVDKLKNLKEIKSQNSNFEKIINEFKIPKINWST